MVELGVVGFKTKTGKGGKHRIYMTLLDERGYIKFIIKTNLKSALRDFYAETKEILNNY